MKIGILTFHCAHNYGAVLQCYALQETLKELGHEVEVIDYRPDYLIDLYKAFDIHRYKSKLKRLIKDLLLAPFSIERNQAFSHFIHSKLNLSQKVIGKEIPSDYDVYIMGSDQIWNPKITNRIFDPVYFGDFYFSKGQKKYITYAASMGTNVLNSDESKYYSQALSHFDAISVRESQLVNLLQPLTDKKIEEVLDPTLLVNPQIWDNMAKKPCVSQKYVLIYQVGFNKNTRRIAESIAKDMGAVVVEVEAFLHLTSKKGMIRCASPEEFLGWIKFASYVVTTSFHGTVFSIIFKRPFYSLEIGNVNTRIRTILGGVGLENRIMNISEHPTFSTPNFDRIDSQLKGMREQSMRYLIRSLSN